LKSSRLRLRSLRSVVAAAAADAVGAEEEEVQLSGGVDAVDEEEAEVMMAFRTH
jgi:30S ribosomal protein 3